MPPVPLPGDVPPLSDAELAQRVYSILQAVDWKWTIAEVLEQPEALLEDVLTLADMAQRVRAEQARSEQMFRPHDSIRKA